MRRDRSAFPRPSSRLSARPAPLSCDPSRSDPIAVFAVSPSFETASDVGSTAETLEFQKLASKKQQILWLFLAVF